VKHYHPSLKEVVTENSNYEWLEANISGFYIGDFVDSENQTGSISSPSFNIFSKSSESEYGTFSYQEATIFIEQADENELQNLIGEFPVGNINYYDSARTFITLKINDKIYNNLLVLLTSNIKFLSIKVAIPVWDDKEAKCLPLLKYQITYKEECGF
jgi:hypothetical protein